MFGWPSHAAVRRRYGRSPKSSLTDLERRNRASEECLGLLIGSHRSDPDGLYFVTSSHRGAPRIVRLRDGTVRLADPPQPKRGLPHLSLLPVLAEQELTGWPKLVFELVKCLSQDQFDALLEQVGHQQVGVAQWRLNRARREVVQSRVALRALRQEVSEAENELARRALRRAVRELGSDAERRLGHSLLDQGFSDSEEALLDTIRGVMSDGSDFA